MLILIKFILKGGFLLKNREYRQRRNLFKLKALQKKGVPEVRWKVEGSQIEVYARYFSVTPCKFEIDISKKCRLRKKIRVALGNEKNIGLLNRLNKAYMGGRKELYVNNLSLEETTLLDSLGIAYRVVRYRITLNP